VDLRDYLPEILNDASDWKPSMAQLREATSVWHQLPPEASARALDAPARDLASGAWDERHGRLRTTPEWDVGLRLLRAEL
jgi:hypothetical protein